MHVSTKKGCTEQVGGLHDFTSFLGTPKSWSWSVRTTREGGSFLVLLPCVCALLWQQRRYLFPWRPPSENWPLSCIITSDKANFQNKRFLNQTLSILNVLESWNLCKDLPETEHWTFLFLGHDSTTVLTQHSGVFVRNFTFVFGKMSYPKR